MGTITTNFDAAVTAVENASFGLHARLLHSLRTFGRDLLNVHFTAAARLDQSDPRCHTVEAAPSCVKLLNSV